MPILYLNSGLAAEQVTTSTQANKDRETDTLMFVPQTPEGELAKILQEADNAFTLVRGTPRMVMVEESGQSLMEVLSCKDPCTVC